MKKEVRLPSNKMQLLRFPCFSELVCRHELTPPRGSPQLCPSGYQDWNTRQRRNTASAGFETRKGAVTFL